MAVKYEVIRFEFGNCLPYGWQTYPGKWEGKVFGHEFTMVGIFRLKKTMFGKSELPQIPALIWREKEFWWEGNVEGTAWTFKGETDKGDLYQSAPQSPTWGGFRQGIADIRSHSWLTSPGADVPQSVHHKLLNRTQLGLIELAVRDVQSVMASKDYKKSEELSNQSGHYNEGQLEMTWQIIKKLAEHRRYLPVVALDRPGMAKSGGSGQSGGGFVSGTTAVSRRRVLQFDLGLVGSTASFTATQIVETINTVPSISKFIIPGMSDLWCRNIPERYLAYLRSRNNLANVEDQTNVLEDESTISRWEQWCARLSAKGLV